MARHTRWSGSVVTATALVGIFACRQIVGITDNPPEALTSTTCGLPYGTNECASCVATSCCAESSACAADQPGCGAFEGCLGKCSGDPGCRSQCFIDHQGFAASGVPALGACLASKCETACGLPCGAPGPGTAPPDTTAACESCFAARATTCADARRCLTSADCIAYSLCLDACSTQSCRQTCAGTHDAGLAPLNPFLVDLVGTCSTQCGIGRNWSCVGHVSWPFPTATTVTMTTFVSEGATLTPVSGADVSVSEYCPPSAEAGAAVLGQGQTGDAGTVTFPVPLQFSNVGPGSGHGLDGCITATAAGFLPTFWYWGFPVTESVVGWVPTQLGPTASSTGIFVPVISTAQVASLNAAAGTTPDATRGIVGATISDCLGIGAPDVQVTIGIHDPAVRTLYGTSLSPTATMTDTSGEVFFVNVPTGSLTLTATPVALNEPSSVVTVNVQANTFTEVLMYPTP